ncbi:MAG: hypothetical protein P1P90_03330 [Patescibacteria group bacterium]|nr:hypothetical protein [Patescibacteria group bacterium]
MSENTVVGRGFTEGELKAAGWWVRNHVAIRTWSRIILIALNVIVWGYVTWGLLDAYAISYARESNITMAIAVNQQNLDRLMQDRPLNVGTSAVLVFPTTEDRVDISVDIENPNSSWWAEFSYRFNVAGEQTPAGQGFVLPGELTTLTALGFKASTPSARTAQLLIDNIRWHRVDPSEVELDYDKYINKRFGGISVQNVRFEPASVAAGRTASRTTFDVVNNGAFGYWSIDYVIKLMRGNTVVAVNKVNLRELKPGETRNIDLYWYDTIQSVTKTEITPVINLLDPNSYLPSSRLTN